MPSLKDLRTSQYLKQSDCEKPLLATIAGYDQVEFEQNGVKGSKWVLKFKDSIKPLVLNVTNGETISGITGTEDFDGWVGTKIVLYADPNVRDATGKKVGGIRVRAPKVQPTAKPKPAPVTEFEPPPSEDEAYEAEQADDIPF